MPVSMNETCTAMLLPSLLSTVSSTLPTVSFAASASMAASALWWRARVITV